MSLTGLNMGDYMEGAVLQIFKGIQLTARPQFFAALHTVIPADTGSMAAPSNGTELTTVNGVGGYAAYARVTLTSNTAWSNLAAAVGDATGQQISNLSIISWPANNGGSTITLVAVSLWDAATLGNMFAYVPISPSFSLTNGAAFSIAAGGLVLQAD